MDGHRLQDDVLGRPVGAVGGHQRDGHGHVEAGVVGDLPEDGVPTVQPGRGDGGDEELRSVGVRAGVGHLSLLETCLLIFLTTLLVKIKI